ncbi:hypothetical protein [Sulfuracidifex metallicus]|uniref:JAB domain-containing protein n=1 Tax=Sulfuracidifex metallicus DSM 6482 = JCM 9184 TaxID=523847 RepID=A0A6A9QHN6_SULME|nr:hypothetical protein [Sulfuracidifex metallicus]MUN28757.1 hypothetical protein [Sulfuracidifex metallicus DSM 6482 = JCM 9184]WOE50726.1 hypothetical protein RQ359_002289 [Sulfuracidifex metallicus DSM 6482 = JCM 9184]
MGTLKEKCGIVSDNDIIEISNLGGIFEFQCDPVELYKALHRRERIIALFHTHPFSKCCYPSSTDKIGMELWRVPWIIIGEKCIRAFRLDGGVVEIDINTLLSQELYNRLMKLFE